MACWVIEQNMEAAEIFARHVMLSWDSGLLTSAMCIDLFEAVQRSWRTCLSYYRIIGILISRMYPPPPQEHDRSPITYRCSVLYNNLGIIKNKVGAAMVACGHWRDFLVANPGVVPELLPHWRCHEEEELDR